MLADQERLHELKEDAKWASSVDGQIRAVRKLGSLGREALPVLEDVLQVIVRDEIRKCCIETIENMGRDSRSQNLSRPARQKKARRKARVSSR